MNEPRYYLSWKFDRDRGRTLYWVECRLDRRRATNLFLSGAKARRARDVMNRDYARYLAAFLDAARVANETRA